MNKNDLYKDIGKRIHECRKKMGFTQERLAEIMDVTPQMISTAENGTKGIRPENIIKFSNALNVSCDYLLTGRSNNYDYSALLDIANSIGYENLDALICLIHALQRLTSEEKNK